jgi:predicted nucleotidyltransferase component of viral defense system
MEYTPATLVERIQTLAAKVLATHAVGHQLCLIGGFRYRLLNASCRASADIDYHWDGDLDRKQAEIVDVLRRRLLPEVQRQFGYEGDIRAATGPAAESPAVRTVDMAFYRAAEAGSRIEVLLEITRIPHLDPPVIRTVAGTVFLTVSDADMIESKIIALLNRTFTRARDILDVFLFQDTLRPDAGRRLAEKLAAISLSREEVAEQLGRLQANRRVHLREIARLLDEQVDPAVAANLRAAGGVDMIWDAALHLLSETLGTEESVS